MIIKGIIYDNDTRQPVPYATIQITDADFMPLGIGGRTNNDGSFNISSNNIGAGDLLFITSIGYTPQSFELTGNDQSGSVFLKKDYQQLPDVTVSASNKKNFWWLALIPLAFIKEKKKIGKIDMSTVAIAGAGFLLFKGFSIFNDLLSTFGIGDGAGTKDVKEEQVDPGSCWKANYWKSLPGSFGVPPMSVNDAHGMSFIIHEAFGITYDNYEAIVGIFGRLTSKAQVSFLADMFQSTYGEDLLTFLTNGGGILPWDGLSEKHLKVIIDLVRNLPAK